MARPTREEGSLFGRRYGGVTQAAGILPYDQEIADAQRQAMHYSTAAQTGADYAAGRVADAQTAAQREFDELSALKAQGVDIPQARLDELHRIANPSFAQQALEKAAPLFKVLEKLDRFNQVIKLGIKDIAGFDSDKGKEISAGNYWDVLSGNKVKLLEELGVDVVGEDGMIGWSTILDDFGWEKTDNAFNKVARGLVSFGGEMLTDPFTWMGAGALGASKSARTGFLKAAVDEPKELLRAALLKGDTQLAERGSSFARNMLSKGDEIHDALKKAEFEKIEDAIRNGTGTDVLEKYGLASIDEMLDGLPTQVRNGMPVEQVDNLVMDSLDAVADDVALNTVEQAVTETADSFFNGAIAALYAKDFAHPALVEIAEGAVTQSSTFLKGGLRMTVPLVTKRAQGAGKHAGKFTFAIPGTVGKGRALSNFVFGKSSRYIKNADSAGLRKIFENVAGGKLYAGIQKQIDRFSHDQVANAIMGGAAAGRQAQLIEAVNTIPKLAAAREFESGIEPLRQSISDISVAAEKSGLTDEELHSLMRGLSRVYELRGGASSDELMKRLSGYILDEGLRPDTLDGDMLAATRAWFVAQHETLDYIGKQFHALSYLDEPLENFTPHVTTGELHELVAEMIRLDIPIVGDSMAHHIVRQIISAHKKAQVVGEERVGEAAHLAQRRVGQSAVIQTGDDLVPLVTQDTTLIHKRVASGVRPDKDGLLQSADPSRIARGGLTTEELNDMILGVLEEAAEANPRLKIPKPKEGRARFEAYNENPVDVMQIYSHDMLSALIENDMITLLENAGLIADGVRVINQHVLASELAANLGKYGHDAVETVKIRLAEMQDDSRRALQAIEDGVDVADDLVTVRMGGIDVQLSKSTLEKNRRLRNKVSRLTGKQATNAEIVARQDAFFQDAYNALRKKGISKKRAARVANAATRRELKEILKEASEETKSHVRAQLSMAKLAIATDPKLSRKAAERAHRQAVADANKKIELMQRSNAAANEFIQSNVRNAQVPHHTPIGSAVEMAEANAALRERYLADLVALGDGLEQLGDQETARLVRSMVRQWQVNGGRFTDVDLLMNNIESHVRNSLRKMRVDDAVAFGDERSIALVDGYLDQATDYDTAQLDVGDWGAVRYPEARYAYHASATPNPDRLYHGTRYGDAGLTANPTRSASADGEWVLVYDMDMLPERVAGSLRAGYDIEHVNQFAEMVGEEAMPRPVAIFPSSAVREGIRRRELGVRLRERGPDIGPAPEVTGLPPVEVGYTRLYRADIEGGAPVTSTPGRWFTDDFEVVEEYAAGVTQVPHGDLTARTAYVSYIDVPDEEAYAWFRSAEDSGEIGAGFGIGGGEREFLAPPDVQPERILKRGDFDERRGFGFRWEGASPKLDPRIEDARKVAISAWHDEFAPRAKGTHTPVYHEGPTRAPWAHGNPQYTYEELYLRVTNSSKADLDADPRPNADILEEFWGIKITNALAGELDEDMQRIWEATQTSLRGRGLTEEFLVWPVGRDFGAIRVSLDRPKGAPISTTTIDGDDVARIPTQWLHDNAASTRGLEQARGMYPDAWVGGSRGQKGARKVGRGAFREDIRTKGIQEPIEVAITPSGKLRVTDGHHRLAAALDEGIEDVPARLVAWGKEPGGGIDVTDRLKPGVDLGATDVQKVTGSDIAGGIQDADGNWIVGPGSKWRRWDEFFDEAPWDEVATPMMVSRTDAFLDWGAMGGDANPALRRHAERNHLLVAPERMMHYDGPTKVGFPPKSGLHQLKPENLTFDRVLRYFGGDEELAREAYQDLLWRLNDVGSMPIDKLQQVADLRATFNRVSGRRGDLAGLDAAERIFEDPVNFGHMFDDADIQRWYRELSDEDVDFVQVWLVQGDDGRWVRGTGGEINARLVTVPAGVDYTKVRRLSRNQVEAASGELDLTVTELRMHAEALNRRDAMTPAELRDIDEGTAAAFAEADEVFAGRPDLLHTMSGITDEISTMMDEALKIADEVAAMKAGRRTPGQAAGLGAPRPEYTKEAARSAVANAYDEFIRVGSDTVVGSAIRAADGSSATRGVAVGTGIGEIRLPENIRQAQLDLWADMHSETLSRQGAHILIRRDGDDVVMEIATVFDSAARARRAGLEEGVHSIVDLADGRAIELPTPTSRTAAALKRAQGEEAAAAVIRRIESALNGNHMDEAKALLDDSKNQAMLRELLGQHRLSEMLDVVSAERVLRLKIVPEANALRANSQSRRILLNAETARRAAMEVEAESKVLAAAALTEESAEALRLGEEVGRLLREVVYGVGLDAETRQFRDPSLYPTMTDSTLVDASKHRLAQVEQIRAHAKALGWDDIEEAAGKTLQTKDYEILVAAGRPASEKTLSVFGLGGRISQFKTTEQVVAHAIERSIARWQAIMQPEGIMQMGKELRWIARAWKSMATVARPNFHTRNFIGAWFNNNVIEVGVHDYAWVRNRAMKYRQMQRNNATRAEMIEFFGERDWQILEDARIHGVFGEGFAAGDYLKDATRDKLHRPTLRQQIDPGSKDALQNQLGARAMTSVEDFHRLAAFYRWYDELGAEGARNMVNMVHFNYADLTAAEASIKRFVPFFVWTRNNVPLQVQLMVERPGLATRYTHLMTSVDDNFGGDDEQWPLGAFQSPFAADLGIQMGSDQNWARMVFDPDVPLLDLASLEQPWKFESWANFLGNSLGPHVTLPLSVSEQNEWGKTNAPMGWNAAIKILDFVTPGQIAEVSAQGDVQVGFGTRNAMNTVLPFLSDYGNLFGIGPNDPNQAQKLGIDYNDGVSVSERLRAGLVFLGRGAGAQAITPNDARTWAGNADARVREVVDDLKRGGFLQPEDMVTPSAIAALKAAGVSLNPADYSGN